MVGPPGFEPGAIPRALHALQVMSINAFLYCRSNLFRTQPHDLSQTELRAHKIYTNLHGLVFSFIDFS